MRTLKFFITGFLCLSFSVGMGLAQNLNTKISIKVQDATLPQVLQQLQKKYGYRFSYLNNELPARSKFTAEIKNKSFSEVLDVLLEKTDLGYKQSNGQIIIKKGFPKNKPKTTTFQKVPVPAVQKTVENKAAQTAKTASNPEAEKGKQPKTESKSASKNDAGIAGNSDAKLRQNVTEIEAKSTISA